ncbi:hypothetical protein HY469_00420 [Candidatus Roizmanbacteria bacterium]|nr:hypothetical protein [Candidatus Roizmanbacteria bacterium]
METFVRRKSSVRLGSGFAESIEESKTSFFSKGSASSAHLLKGTLPFILFFCGFFLLAGRLLYLTWVQGAYYQTLGDSNRLREERIVGARGVIYDRDGEVLASNRPIYRITENSSAESPNPRKRIISREEALEREAAGEQVAVELGRTYPEGGIVPHAVGYMAEITEQQYTVVNDAIRKYTGVATADEFCQYCYGMGDFVGITGIEETYEDVLRGTSGKRLLEVDAQGRELSELARIAPVNGKNLYTALDVSLQRVAAEALETIRSDKEVNAPAGAVIATRAKTGEVLALYSSPSFDPNLFVNQHAFEQEIHQTLFAPQKSLEEILTDINRPVYNRVLSGLYQPGSTFKIITAASGIEEGVLTSETKVEDTGVITIGPFSFANWYYTQYGGKEGEVNIVRALARSNDIFFYKVGEWVGIDKLEKWAKTFKAATIVGIEIPGEAEGLVRLDRKWYLGDTYHVAIGQGDVIATPLQVNTWAQIIANDGKFCRPTLLKHNPPTESDSMQPLEIECQSVEIGEETLQLITEGMKQACAEGGTAYPFFTFEPRVACKTGTAEFGHPQNKTHAWFTAFAPADDPEIVVTVLVEAGGEGSSVAAPVAKNILTEYFRQ